MLHTPLEQVAKHGNKVGSGQTIFRIDQTTKVHVWPGRAVSNWKQVKRWVPTGIAKAEAIGRTAKGEQPAVRFYGADEALEELADVLLHSQLLHRREELQDEVEERLREAGDEALLGCAGLGVAGRVRVGMRDMAGSGFGGVLLGCDGHGGGGRGQCGGG